MSLSHSIYLMHLWWSTPNIPRQISYFPQTITLTEALTFLALSWGQTSLSFTSGIGFGT